MNKKIALILLLTLAQPALAGKLYKWTEADGSTTFSPNKPADGIKFEVVSSEDKKPAVKKAKKPAKVVKATPKPATDKIKAGITKAEPIAVAAVAVDPESLSKIGVPEKKSKQCIELGKRVFSLERRLKLDLSEEEMDNTVIQMVKYQSSYDKYCNR